MAMVTAVDENAEEGKPFTAVKHTGEKEFETTNGHE